MENGLFSLVPRSRIEDVLRNLSAFTDLPAQLLDAEGGLLLSFGKSTAYCSILKKQVFAEGSCQEIYKKAGLQALKLGESYIFTCHADLNHIAFPLSSCGQLLGSVILGPFLMDAPDSTLVSGIAEQYRLKPLLSLELYDELSSVRVIPPQKVSQLSVLLNDLLSPLLREQAILRENREKQQQQSRIGESIQRYKTTDTDSTYFFEKENLLLQKARTGNTTDVKTLLNDLLGYVFFSEGGKLEAVRMRAIGLTALLSQVASEGGATAEALSTLSRRYEELLSRNQSYEDLCYLMQQVAEGFMAAMFHAKGQEKNPAIRKALQYIAEHYSEDISTSRISKEAGLSPNYFSTLFKQSLGMGCRDYLTHLRLEEACHLLRCTDYPLTDIALSVGFADQSTFCKCFKRLFGVSPRQYRGKAEE